jgi:O-antigen chain-terminating methyltransferase
MIIRNLNTLEANTFAQLQAQHNHINTLADTAQFKINELIDKHGQVGAVLDQKADRDELGQLKEEVEGVLEQKADKEQIEPIKNETSEILRQTRDNKLNILDQQRRLVLLLEEARKRLPEPISTDQIKKMLTEEDHLLDAMYVSFECVF